LPSNSRYSRSELRPARTSPIICRRSPGGNGRCICLPVDLHPTSKVASTPSGQPHGLNPRGSPCRSSSSGANAHAEFMGKLSTALRGVNESISGVDVRSGTNNGPDCGNLGQAPAEDNDPLGKRDLSAWLAARRLSSCDRWWLAVQVSSGVIWCIG
jgi:hypothetical protein